ncbi:hypothetical protein ACKGJI_06285 [Sulfurospirillum sp. 1307]|jgi:adenylate kinase family enzyme
MRFSYKKLVERFEIPRPTLIDWQKRVKKEKNNWRVKHLAYLKEQLIIEDEILRELQRKPILVEDIFLLSVFLFFNKDIDYMQRDNLKKELKKFAYENRSSVEYRHDFAKRIWSYDQDKNLKTANYYKVIDLLDSLNISQYVFLVRMIKNFIYKIDNKLKPSYTNLLDGLTWQELHMYDKAFSNDAIKKYFKDLNINNQQSLFS